MKKFQKPLTTMAFVDFFCAISTPAHVSPDSRPRRARVPSVSWAQRPERLFVTINVANSSDPVVTFVLLPFYIFLSNFRFPQFCRRAGWSSPPFLPARPFFRRAHAQAR
jgi:hypothetical protein